MKRVFADSFYFFAILNEEDPLHDFAVELTGTFRGELVTTGWILTEVGGGFRQPHLRDLFLELNERLKSNPHVRIEPCSDELFDAGIDLYRNRPDKSWSLTDCISFVIMQHEDINEALTGDRDFEQAGFVALLK